jgi:hypothetical protein
METIRNMTQNQNQKQNQIQTKANSETDILDKLGLEDMPDLDQLLAETENEQKQHYKLLDKLGIKSSIQTEISDTESEMVGSNAESDIDLESIAKVSKAKTSNRTKQIVANI